MRKILVDEMAEYIPLRSWIKEKEFEDGIVDFKYGIENDLEQLSKLLGIDLVIMAIKPRKPRCLNHEFSC